MYVLRRLKRVNSPAAVAQVYGRAKEELGFGSGRAGVVYASRDVGGRESRVCGWMKMGKSSRDGLCSERRPLDLDAGARLRRVWPLCWERRQH
jgi:hypothetical protein